MKLTEALESAGHDQSVSYWKTENAQNLAFVADMDAQFIYVPKTWIRGILRVRISCRWI